MKNPNEPVTVKISRRQHTALTEAANANGYTVGKLLSIIIDVALLGIPFVIRKWRKLQQPKQ